MKTSSSMYAVLHVGMMVLMGIKGNLILKQG